MRFKKWLGLVIGFCGMIPIILSTSPAEAAAFPLGNMFSLPELAAGTALRKL